MLDIKPLCNIKAGHEVPRLLNEYVGKLILASIPALERENFCNGSSTPDLGNELQSIAAQGRKFLEWAALAQLAVALAQDTSIDEDIRKHIAIHRAEGFVAMCLARQLPPSGAVDPVTWSGWDRTSDAGTLDNLQNECAAVTDSCLRLAYRSQLGPFLGDPKAWYTRAVQFLTGPSYTNILGLITCAGPENVTQELWEWNLKLTVLREAAGKIEGVLEPQEVLDSLCNDIGISAVNAAACDDSTKEQVRQLFREMGKDVHHVQVFSDKIASLFNSDVPDIGPIKVVKLEVPIFKPISDLFGWIAKKQRNSRARDFVDGRCKELRVCQ